MSKESFSEFYDMIPFIILKAPDHFPTDYEMDLEKSFSQLNAKEPLINKICDNTPIIQFISQGLI